MVTGMSERTKEALVPSIKNGRALLKSLGGMQISGVSPSEPPAKGASPAPEPGNTGALAGSRRNKTVFGAAHCAHSTIADHHLTACLHRKANL